MDCLVFSLWVIVVLDLMLFEVVLEGSSREVTDGAQLRDNLFEVPPGLDDFIEVAEHFLWLYVFLEQFQHFRVVFGIFVVLHQHLLCLLGHFGVIEATFGCYLNYYAYRLVLFYG